MRLRARLSRWWHCLTHLHRGVTVWSNGRVCFIGCECGWTALGDWDAARRAFHAYRPLDYRRREKGGL